MSSLEEELKARVQGEQLDLPVLPAVGTQVLALARNEDSDAAQLAQLIQNDQSLSGHVMKLANSAAYNTGAEIKTLQQAIARLGMNQIGQMALAICVGQSAFKPTAATEQLIGQLWRESLARACWAREIARILRANVETAFLSGLLCEIGKPAILHAVAQITSCVASSDLPSDAELSRLVDHYNREAGLQIARLWKLPESVIAAIEFVDSGDSAQSYQQATVIVNASKLLAEKSAELSDLTELFNALSTSPVFSALNFYDEDIGHLLERATIVASTVSGLTI